MYRARQIAAAFKAHWLRPLKWTAAPAAAVLLATIGASYAAGARLVARSDAQQPRDSAGLLIGAAPRDLGPENAECAVLLVHGYLGCGNNFGRLPERLAQSGFRVRVMLLPGHGTSPRNLANVSGDQLLKAVLDEIDRLRPNHKRLVLVGHSMGGTLATLAAAQRPVNGLVLAAPYFGVTTHWYYGLNPETWAKLSGPVVPWLYKGQHMIQVNKPDARPHIVSYRWVPASSVKMLMGLAKQANKPDLLAKINCPVLLIHSHNDQAASPEAAQNVLQKIPCATQKTVWLDRSNHILFWDYDAEQAINETVSFCQKRH
ncbi:MAG TPA: alpha/beta fold hydrolase [Candidatus Bathyarchaeia archaeon]|nr:alpha/beta fold hydrolase [Candidatus Bathyarchaeia archaeon]